MLSWETFSEIYINDFQIDDNTLIHGKFDSNTIDKQFFWRNWEYNDTTGVIGFLLCDKCDNLNLDSFSYDFSSDNITIEGCDFHFIFDFLKKYKSIVEQYNQRQDPIKLAFLQTQVSKLEKEKFLLIREKQDLINERNKLQNDFNSLSIKKEHLELLNLNQDLIIKRLESKKLAKLLGIRINVINPRITFVQINSAKLRIQNHLSYKLGQAMIENSKSILGYIRMPYVLSYIKDKHKFEQKIYKTKIKEDPCLSLPPLETYFDYEEALKEKECFTYKLGQEFIKASNNWYRGGYIKFLFWDLFKIKSKK
ncbi:sugar transferase [Campylobacter coli]|nr:sugar transferase [Campylobacter coli]